MATTLSISELMSKPFVGELTEGKHTATLANWMHIVNPVPDKEYIRMTFVVDNEGVLQEYTRNLFLRDISIALSHLRRQLGRTNESIDPRAFLNELKNQQTPLDIWVSYPIVSSQRGAKRVQNLYFQPPITAPADAATAAPIDDSDMETPLAE